MNPFRKKRSSYCYLVYALCLVVLYGCISAGDGVSLPDSQPTPVEIRVEETTPTLPALTSIPLSTATASATPTYRPEAYTPTPTLPGASNESEAPEAEEALDACVDTSLIFENSENSEVRWRFDDVGEVYCCDHSGVYKIYQNNDPASSLVVFSIITDRNVPVYSDNVLVDLATGDFKILGHDYTETPKYAVAWLPDETVVWADDKGELYIGSIETQESLNAPARMTDLWFVAPDRILARDEALQFWYFDLTNSLWTQLPESESEKITWEWIDYAAASEDGEYVFFFFQDSIATLSNDSETVNIIDREELYPIASSGSDEYPLWYPPEQIKGTSYWFLNTIWLIRDFSGISYPTFRFIINSRTGEVAEHEVLGIPVELAIYDSYLSPDGAWVAVEVVEAIQTLENHPARVSQTWFISLATGEMRVEEGAFEGWDPEREAYLHAPLSCSEREIIIDLAPQLKNEPSLVNGVVWNINVATGKPQCLPQSNNVLPDVGLPRCSSTFSPVHHCHPGQPGKPGYLTDI